MQQLSLSIIFECFGFHAIVSLGSSHKFPQVCYLKITMFVAQNVFQLGSTTLSIGQIRNTLLVSSVFEGIFFRAIVLSNIPCCVLVKLNLLCQRFAFFSLQHIMHCIVLKRTRLNNLLALQFLISLLSTTLSIGQIRNALLVRFLYLFYFSFVILQFLKQVV